MIIRARMNWYNLRRKLEFIAKQKPLQRQRKYWVNKHIRQIKKDVPRLYGPSQATRRHYKVSSTGRKVLQPYTQRKSYGRRIIDMRKKYGFKRKVNWQQIHWWNS